MVHYIQRVIEHFDKRFREINGRFEEMNERITFNLGILKSHSDSLKFIIDMIQNVGNLKDIAPKMVQLEHSSATQYKTLDGKIDTKFNQLDEKIDTKFEQLDVEIKELKENMATKHNINDLKKFLSNLL